jgi:5-methyltetrahydrofolate--homocysteine methyltransferase
MEPLVQELFDSIVDGNRQQAKTKTQTALEAGISPEVLLKEGMIPAMKQVGERFTAGEYYVPEMLIAARAMQEGMTLIKPRLVGAKTAIAGRIVMGTVSGDLHDIGKNLVSMMEGAGFEIIDLGTDVPPTKFVQAIRTHHPDLLGMSALVTTTMPGMQATLDALRAEGVRDQVKVLVGGAPVTEEYAKKIGADGFAADASRAVTLAKALLAKRT